MNWTIVFFALFLSRFLILWQVSTSFEEALTSMSESTGITTSTKSLSKMFPGIQKNNNVISPIILLQ